MYPSESFRRPKKARFLTNLYPTAAMGICRTMEA